MLKTTHRPYNLKKDLGCCNVCAVVLIRGKNYSSRHTKLNYLCRSCNNKRHQEYHRKTWILSARRRLCRRAKNKPIASLRELQTLWTQQEGRCGLTFVPIPENTRPHLDHI